jgi:hypothetical protein
MFPASVEIQVVMVSTEQQNYLRYKLYATLTI